MKKSTEKQDKKQVFNLIIADESGSMYIIRKQAFSGLNETISKVNAQITPDAKVLVFNNFWWLKTTLFNDKHRNYTFKIVALLLLLMVHNQLLWLWMELQGRIVYNVFCDDWRGRKGMAWEIMLKKCIRLEKNKNISLSLCLERQEVGRHRHCIDIEMLGSARFRVGRT